MKSRPLISAQTTSTPDVTDSVNLIKAPLRHFQTPAYIRASPEIEAQATDSTELFTQNLIAILTFGMCILVNVSND